MSQKTISFVVPSYNVEEYLPRCIESLVGIADNSDVDVIVVDDGSKDGTGAVADKYAELYPNVVRVIHQVNAGHGGAVNAGVAAAQGLYTKVVDADDWIDSAAYVTYMAFLRAQKTSSSPVDLVVANYVYENTATGNQRPIRFENVFDANIRLTWDDVRECSMQQYLLMHTLTYRTDVLRESQLRLPEHTFYVDFIFAFQPLAYVKTLTYLNIDFYRYFIGREGQSVETDTMIKRVDQLIRVNGEMVKAMPSRDKLTEGQYRYMLHYLASNFIVTSVFLTLAKTPERTAQKNAMWSSFRSTHPDMYRDMRKKEVLARLATIRGALGRVITEVGYTVSQKIIGFNN